MHEIVLGQSLVVTAEKGSWTASDCDRISSVLHISELRPVYLRFVSEAMKDGTISASAVVFPKEADFAVPRLEWQLPFVGSLR